MTARLLPSSIRHQMVSELRHQSYVLLAAPVAFASQQNENMIELGISVGYLIQLICQCNAQLPSLPATLIGLSEQLLHLGHREL